MKIIKRLLCCVLVCFSLFACMAGCTQVDKPSGGGDDGGTKPPVIDGGAEDGKTNLVVGIISDMSEKEMMQAVIDAYENTHTDVNIRIMSIAGNYSQQIVNLASSGELPDVYMNQDTLVGYLAKSNVSLDLTPYLSKYNLSASDFYPSIYKLGLINDKVYMLPREYAHAVVYYNKKILNDAGVDMSIVKNGWTWDDFEQVAAKLVKKRGSIVTQYGADIQLNWPTTIMGYIYGKGGTLFSDDKKSSTIDNSNTVAAYQHLKTKVDEGVFTNVFKAGTPTFLNGKVGMYISVRPQANLIDRTFGEGNWDVVAYPAMTGAAQYVGSGTTGYSVSSFSEKRDAAVDFLMYMMSEEGMSVMAKTGLIIPSRISMGGKDAPWRTYPNANINQEAFVYEPNRDMLPLSSYIADPSKSSKVIDALNLATESLMINCDVSKFSEFKKSITTAMQ